MLLIGRVVGTGVKAAAKAAKNPAVRRVLGQAGKLTRQAGKSFVRTVQRAGRSLRLAPGSRAGSPGGGLIGRVQRGGIAFKKNVVDAVEGFTKPLGWVEKGLVAFGIADIVKKSLPKRNQPAQPDAPTDPTAPQPTVKRPSQPAPRLHPPAPQPQPLPTQPQPQPAAPRPAGIAPQPKSQPVPPHLAQPTVPLGMRPVIQIVAETVQINLGNDGPVPQWLLQEAAWSLQNPSQAEALLSPPSNINTLEELRIYSPQQYIDATIARNAQELVERQGTMTAQGQIYQSDRFTVTNAEGSFTIRDPEGQIQMQFRPPEPGSEIPQTNYKSDEMSHELHLELLAARPDLRLQPSPTSIDAGNALAAASVALAALRSTEAQQTASGSVFEGNVYRFEQQENTLTITALDGRGDILEMTDGKLQHYSLTPADVEKFERAAAQLIGATQAESIEGATMPAQSTADNLER